MMDEPRGDEILESVAKLIRDTLIPQLPAGAVFQARVAANAIDLVRRQMIDGERFERASHARLCALLGHDGEPAALERELCDRIRDRSLGADTPGLLAHLMATTMAKMAVDQPTYASYRRELETRSTPQRAKE